MAANLSFTQYEQAAVRIRKAFRHSAGLLFLTARQLLLRCVIPALLGRGRWIVVVVEGLLTVRFSVRVDLFLPFGQQEKSDGTRKGHRRKKRGSGFALQRRTEHLSCSSFPLGCSITNKNVPFSRCTIFEDFSLVFRREKRRCTNFVQSESEGAKKRKQVCPCFLSKRLILG